MTPGVGDFHTRQGVAKASHCGSPDYFHPDPGEPFFNLALFHRITRFRIELGGTRFTRPTLHQAPSNTMIQRIELLCSIALAIVAGTAISIATAADPQDLAQQLEKFQDLKFGFMMHLASTANGAASNRGRSWKRTSGPGPTTSGLDRTRQGPRPVPARLLGPAQDVQSHEVRPRVVGEAAKDCRHEVRRLSRPSTTTASACSTRS